MFYRFFTSFVTSERLKLKRVDPIPNGGDPVEEIFPQPPWPKCRVFKGLGRSPEWFSDMQFAEGKENEPLPDLYLRAEMVIVSKKMRQVIEEVDDMGHQFEPCTFLDHTGKKVERGEYYHMVILRRLWIEDSKKIPNTDFFATSLKYLTTVQDCPDLKKKIEGLPLWQDVNSLFYIYE